MIYFYDEDTGKVKDTLDSPIFANFLRLKETITPSHFFFQVLEENWIQKTFSNLKKRDLLSFESHYCI